MEFAVAPPQSGSSSTDSRWNLEMLVFVEGGKPESPEIKTLGERTRTNNKLNPHITPGPGIEPWATLVGGECSHNCTIPALPIPNSNLFHF